MIGAVTRRLLVVAVATITLGAIGIGAALGIVYGEPDGGEHPYVGSMVIQVPGPEGDQFFQACTGTLVEGAADADGDDVFLTAAHCVVGLQESLPPGSSILVTFDEEITPGGTYYAGDIHYNPRFGSHGMADLFDVAVIVLDQPTGIGQYGELPEAGLLDGMKSAHSLKDQIFTAVGYGAVRETRKGGFSAILDNERRNKADQGFLSLTNAWITFSMNQANGNAGTCYGDSGGPHFLGGTSTIVSLTVTGDSVCKATDKTYRMDTAAARDFLKDWVVLP